MEHTIVNLSLPYTFSDEGEYLVSNRGKIARIKIEYVQSTETLNKITGIISTGKVAMKPDDPEGLANFSKITMELPYVIPNGITELSGKALIGSNGTEENLFFEIRKECAVYLNKLREAIRYCTRRYWIRDISIRHIYIYNVRPEKDGKGRTYMSLLPPMDYNTMKVEIRNEDEVKEQIEGMLKNERKIELSERIYLDSLNFFTYGRYQEVIVNANTAMEVALAEQVRNLATEQGKTPEEVDEIVQDIFEPRKFKSQFKRAFFRNSQENEIKELDIFKNIEDIRNKRGNVVHPGIKFFSEDETRDQLFKIHDIILWIKSQKYLS